VYCPNRGSEFRTFEEDVAERADVDAIVRGSPGSGGQDASDDEDGWDPGMADGDLDASWGVGFQSRCSDGAPVVLESVARNTNDRRHPGERPASAG
jgi:hypothetical protein